MKYLSDKLFAYFPYIFSFIYFILLFFLETSILHVFQNKSFLTSSEFLVPYLMHSGGIMDYCGLFLSEILQFNFAGAILYSFITLISILLYKNLLEKTGVTKNLLLISLYPFIFLVLLTFNYFHPISINLKLLFGLLILQFLLYGSDKGIFLKFLSFFALVGYWYLCGLEFYIIVLVYMLLHTAIHKTFVHNIFVFVLSAISIALLNTFVYYTPLSASIDTINDYHSQIPFILLFTYLLFLLLPVFAIIRLNKTINHALHLLIILVVGSALSIWSYNKANHTIGRIMVAGNNNDYNKVLLLRDNTLLYTKIISAYTNIALINKRSLLDYMFKYNQAAGIEGLLPSHEFDSFNSFTNMKVCFNMGLINQTIRWAMEATSKFGHNADILKHLVLAHLINGNVKASEKYYSMYKNTLFNAKQKKQIGEILENYKNGKFDSLIIDKIRLMPQYDFISGKRSNKESFAWAAEANNNTKAFEMYIAICLLENDFEKVRNLISRFRILGYKRLPIHVQEAICLGKAPPDFYNYQIDPLIRQNCTWFYQTLGRYNEDLKAAHDEIFKRAGNTYWYYLSYVSPVTKNIIDK